MHSSAPDILLAPSKLSAMTRNVMGTLVVNPGTVMKQGAPGTYADLHIHPLPESTLREACAAPGPGPEEEVLVHRVADRTRVIVQRI